MRSTLFVGSVSNITSETVPVFVQLTVTLLQIIERFLILRSSFLQAIDGVMSLAL